MKRSLILLGLFLLILAFLASPEQAAGPLNPSDTLDKPSREETGSGTSDFTPYDTPPAPLETPRPDYPEVALKAGIQGRVFVKILVNPDGRVMEARVAKSSGNADLDQAAVQGAKRYKFSPALYEGKPVRVWITMPLSFVLKGKYTLSVLGLNPYEVSSAVTKATMDTLIAELVKFDNKSWYSLVLGEQRERLLGDSAFQRTEFYDSPLFLAQFGKALGVDIVIGGNVRRVERSYSVNLSLINVSTAMIVRRFSVQFAGKPETAPALLPPLVAEIIYKGPDRTLMSILDTSDLNISPPDSNRVPKFNEFVQYDVPPTPLETPHPYYPPTAILEGREGTVVVQLLLNTDGSVMQTRVARSSGHPDLDQAATKGAMRFKFKPAKHRDTPVRVWVAMPIVFKLPR